MSDLDLATYNLTQAARAADDVNADPTGEVTISGTAVVGQTLTVSNTLADADGMENATVHYQWQIDRDDVPGATGTSYTLTDSDLEHHITVVATYTDDLGHDESMTSDPTAVVTDFNAPSTGGVTIHGVARVGATLTATNTLADADGMGTVTYQWKVDGVDVDGATSASFVVAREDLGKHISVDARYTDGGGHDEHRESASTPAVSLPPSPPPPSITLNVPSLQAQFSLTSNSNGPPTRVLKVSEVRVPGQDDVGHKDIAKIGLTSPTGVGPDLLTALLPTGFGLTVTGFSTPTATYTSLDGLTSALGNLLTPLPLPLPLDALPPGFASALPTNLPLVLTGLLPTLSGSLPMDPLVLSALPQLSGAPATALVIDTHGLLSGALLQLQNIGFAAVIGDAHITGGDGSQNVWGDGGSQYIVLGADDDELHGGAGDDVIGSKTGDDLLYGDAGHDFVFGGEESDHVFGGADADRVQGNQGDDHVQGNQGDDTAAGGQGQDFVRGGQGDDRVFGDLGDDTLAGDLGDDTLTGGAGADRFVFGAHAGADVVSDFNFAEGDRLAFDSDLTDHHWTVAATGGGALITFADGGSVLLVGVDAGAVNQGWFI